MHYLGCATSDYRYWSVSSVLIYDVMLLRKLDQIWDSQQNGAVPTRHFFVSRLRRYFDRDVAGQSMRAGGATSLAENGIPPSLIQLIGRWTSDAFFIYIRKSPVLIQALLYSGRQT